jgi:hypothetical protein
MVTTIRDTTFSCGRFPKSLSRESDFIENLIEQAVAEALPLLTGSDTDIIIGAKKITRRLIRECKIEKRWYSKEINPKTLKPVRKSESQMRQVHPVPVTDEDGKTDFTGAVDSAACGIDGKHIPGSNPVNINQVAEDKIAQLEQEYTVRAIIGVIGDDAWYFALNYSEHLGDGTASAADRKRYQRLRAQIKAALPDVEPL